MPPIAVVELPNDFAKFRFLCETPTLEITPALEEEECLICKEPYHNDGWQLGQTVHRPLGLPCGHVLGFHCLALWMLSTNFDNHCPLCRTNIYDPSTATDPLSPALGLSFVRLEVLAATGHNGISRSEKRWLLKCINRSLAPGTTTENPDRMTVVWEVFLNKMGKKTARPDRGNPPAIEGHQVIANRPFRPFGSWDQISHCFLPMSSELAWWLFFYGVSLLFAAEVGWWTGLVGGEATLNEMVETSKTLFIGCIVGLPVVASRMPMGYKIICSAVVFVLLCRLLVLWVGFYSVSGLNPSVVLFFVRRCGLEEARELIFRESGIIF